jgi:hypothetical protein
MEKEPVELSHWNHNVIWKRIEKELVLVMRRNVLHSYMSMLVRH